MCSRSGSAPRLFENSALKVKGQSPSQRRPERPQFGEEALVERGAQVRRSGRAAGAALVADDPLDGKHMLVPPARQRVVDVEKLFGELVKVEPAFRIAIDLEPGGGD